MSNSEQSPQDHPVNVAVIIGSTRPGRLAPRIARWLMAQLEERAELAVDVIDLEVVDLPAALPGDDHPAAAELIDRVDRADGFIVVTPEYNHGYPASLKQAIDVPYREWNAKPVAFVSYGGASGGIRAVEQLRQVFGELHAVPLRNGVAFPGTRVDADGVAEDADAAAAAAAMVDDLVWWARVLREGRAERARGSAPPAVRRGRSSEDDAAAIRSILEAMADGFNRRDVALADERFTADAVLVTPAGRRVEGADAITRYHEARLAGPATTWTTTYRILSTTFVDPRVAVVHTAQDVQTSDGAFQNHGTFVFVKRGDHWWISAAHNTNVDRSDPDDADDLGLVESR